MKKKLLLIDAYSIICRGFYALPTLSNSKGQHTNAVLGFLNILFRTIDEENPDYIAVAFDVNKETFRHKKYKDYKGNRKPMPDELKEQVPYVKDILKTMNIPIYFKEGYEADDILGTISNMFSNDKLESCILSGDKDMLQLATNNIKIRLVKTVKSNSDIYTYYAKDVKDEMGITPIEYIDLKAIMGDPSDNIPGVKGVGKITANDLIIKYNSIDNIYKHIDEITKKSVVKSFLEQKDEVLLYKELVTIVKDVPLEINIDDLKINNLFNIGTFNIFKNFELKSLYKKFDNKIKNQNKINNDSEYVENRIVNDDFDLDNLFSDKNKSKYNDDDDKFSYNLKERYKKLDTYDIDSNDIYKKFIFTKKIESLSLMSYLINPLNKNYEELEYIKQDELYNDLYKKLNDLKLVDLYENVELPLVKVLYNIEKIGIGVDKNLLKEFTDDLVKKVSDIENNIHKLANDESFNINSPKQLGEILFNKLKLDYERKKGEKHSTGIEVLEKLKGTHPIINEIIEYRTLSKLLTTYALSLPKYIVNNRIHTNFNQIETATGRLSSDNPNLQNIPIKTEIGRNLRKIFVPRDGYVFIDADYSQIELRVMAILSGDENLLSAYKDAKDIHKVTASQVFQVPLDEVTEELRRKAKAVNFGLLYGMSSFGLGEDLHIDQKEAKVYIDKYFETYKNVKLYLDKTVEDAKNNGYVRTYYGRIRPIPEFRTGNHFEKAFAKRVAMNSPIQGTAADIIKIAMLNIDKELEKQNLESRLIMQVHDEVLIETKIGEEEKVKNILLTQMTESFDFPIELSINISVGNNWYEAH